MKIDELRKYKKILIIGYGKEGKVTEEFLKRFIPEAIVGVADQKDGANYLDVQKNYDLVIKSPSVKKELIYIPCTTATNIFFANTQNKIIGITGTKGKSTTSTLIHLSLTEAGFKSFLIGNIGTPALSQLMTPHEKNDIFVMELSSYQLSDINYSPHIAVFLNIYPEHNDYHGSFENYFLAKSNIARFLSENDYFVYNSAFAQLQDLSSKIKSKTVPFIDKIPFNVENIRLKGVHNQNNIRAVVTVCNILGIKPDITEKACNVFQGLPHRMETIGVHDGIVYVDDGAATTPQSTIFAIQTIPNIDTLFLGGLNRGYDFSQLVHEIKEQNISNVVLFPDSGRAILDEMKEKQSIPPRILETSSMKEAVQFAFAHTKKGAVCLLSSASPSYSLWRNWDEKGDEFKKYIEHYAAKIS